MRKETDLDAVKETAKILLMTEIHKTDMFPFVSHPFTSNAIVSLHTEDGNCEILDIAASSDNLHKWQNNIKALINKADNPYHIYLMVNQPYALTFLKFTMPYLSQKDFSNILSSAWIMTEAPHNDVNVGLNELVNMFTKADPQIIMDEDEYKKFLDLLESITVYRGVTEYNAKNIKALSWTLNKDTAEWFANRFGNGGTVYRAEILKQHIFAVFDGRNESEVIVNPKYLTDITEVQDMTSDFSLSM